MKSAKKYCVILNESEFININRMFVEHGIRPELVVSLFHRNRIPSPTCNQCKKDDTKNYARIDLFGYKFYRQLKNQFKRQVLSIRL